MLCNLMDNLTVPKPHSPSFYLTAANEETIGRLRHALAFHQKSIIEYASVRTGDLATILAALDEAEARGDLRTAERFRPLIEEAEARGRTAGLEEARRLMNRMRGHQHWGRTQQHGAGCELCIAQREAFAELDALIPPGVNP